MIDIDIGSRVVFSKARFAGSAIYDSRGNITNYKDPKDSAEHGVVVEKEEHPVFGTVLTIEKWKGMRVKFYEGSLSSDYWIRRFGEISA